MSYKLLEPGLYARLDDKENVIGFYERPWVGGKRTMRVLKASNLKDAKKALAANRTDHQRSSMGMAQSPYVKRNTVANILDRFVADGAQGRKRRKPSTQKAVDAVNSAVENLTAFFGRTDAMRLNQKELIRYEHHRRAQIVKKYSGIEMALPRTGARTVELEATVLSNALNHALRLGLIPYNPIAHREGVRLGSEIRHSRDLVPASSEVIHQVANFLFQEPGTQPVAWQILFLSLTGCRRSESQFLKWDAASMDEPGFIDGNHLFIRRAKGGVNPYLIIGPELDGFIKALRNWRLDLTAVQPLAVKPCPIAGQPFFLCHHDSVGKAITRACAILDVPRFTPHSLRAFYVTVRRSLGISDGQIAAEIGDATGPSIIAQVYGSIPANWRGSSTPLTLAPANPAWAKWLPKEPENIIEMKEVAA